MRQRLPNRRGSIRFSIEYDGLRYGVTASYFPGGKLGEIFLDAAKPNSTLGVLVSDAAISASCFYRVACREIPRPFHRRSAR